MRDILKINPLNDDSEEEKEYLLSEVLKDKKLGRTLELLKKSITEATKDAYNIDSFVVDINIFHSGKNFITSYLEIMFLGGFIKIQYRNITRNALNNEINLTDKSEIIEYYLDELDSLLHDSNYKKETEEEIVLIYEIKNVPYFIDDYAGNKKNLTDKLIKR